MGFVLGASGLPCKSRDHRFYDIERPMPPDCYREAARRLLRDANQLMGCNPRRGGTAYHLYGLVAECALKFKLVGPNHNLDGNHKHHDLSRLFSEVNRSRTGRSGPVSLRLSKHLNDWRNESRYWSDQVLARLNVEELRLETEKLFNQLAL